MTSSTAVTDALGRKVTFEYDGSGNRIRMVDGAAVTSYSYDDSNRLTGVTDATGATVSYHYAAPGCPSCSASIQRPKEIVDPLGHLTKFHFDRDGRVIGVEDPLANLTAYMRDGNGRVTMITDANGGATSYQYDPIGRMSKRTDALGNTISNTYDSRGYLTAVTDQLGNVKEHEYDAAGYKSRDIDPLGHVTAYGYYANGWLKTVTDPTGVVATLSYDAAGRRTAVVFSDGRSSSFEYDAAGRLVKQIDANSNPTTFAYDAVGRLIQQTDAAGGVTALTYTPQGKLLTLTDPQGNTTTFAYDLVGHKTKEIRPMGQTTEYSYDPGGRIQTVQDGKGQVRSYAYDDVGRLSEIRYADGKSDAFGYDAVGNLTSWSGADGVSGSARYDAMNRKLSETIDYGDFSKSMAYSYDAKGNKASYTSPEGIEHSYGYDQLGRPTTIAFAGQTVRLSYDKTRLKQVVFPGGVTSAYGYNSSNWLSSIKTVGPNSTILSRGYSFDQVGNITSQTSEQGATTYGYDATYQLTSANHPTLPAEAFGYDQAGNRLSSNDITGALSYNANNELIGHSAAVYEYDANGNTVKKTAGGQITNYQYNARNRLEKVYLPDGRVASYRYDPFGRRVSKQVANEVSYFAYADEGLVGEYAASGTVEKVYGWRPGGLWGTNPLYLVEGGSYYFYHNDHLGTPQKLTDGSGNVAWSAGYTAFGMALVDSASTFENNLRFPGQYFDAETGEHYNWQRYFDPVSGRYTQVDPIGFAGGDLNLYRYVQNNSVNRIDPRGLEPTIPVVTSDPAYDSNKYFSNPSYDNNLTQMPPSTTDKIVGVVDVIINNPVTDIIDSIPPGESTGIPTADLVLNGAQIVKEIWNRTKKKCGE